MAVVDKYVDSKISGNNVDKLLNSLAAGAGKLIPIAQTFEVAAGDDDGSVYRVFKSLNANLIPLKIDIYTDGITNGTDWDLGLYRPDLGAVIDKDCFMDGQTFAVATTLGGVPLYGLKDVDIDSIFKRLFEHAGHTIATRLEGYDLALTANTVGTAAGTVTVIGWFAQG